VAYAGDVSNVGGTPHFVVGNQGTSAGLTTGSWYAVDTGVSVGGVLHQLDDVVYVDIPTAGYMFVVNGDVMKFVGSAYYSGNNIPMFSNGSGGEFSEYIYYARIFPISFWYE
jgi:hypothetical protein